MATKKKASAEANGVLASDPGVLTLAEAAALLRVAEEGLRGDAESGHVPARKVAGEWRFVKAKLLEWLGQSANGVGLKSMLSVAGSFKEDETLPAMLEEIYRERKDRGLPVLRAIEGEPNGLIHSGQIRVAELSSVE